MRNLISMILFLSMPFWCGCIRLYNHQQYHVKVIDAEQNIPVEDAKVSPGYVYFMVFNVPKLTEAITDQSGLAELKVANFFPRHLNVSAEGYIPVRRLDFQHDRPIPDSFKNQNANEVIVPIYQKPEPQIEIVVPDGYRGPVALDLIPAAKLIQDKSGKRFFSYKIMPNGYVRVQASPLLYDIEIDSITARYENGITIPYVYRSPDRVGFRWVDITQHKYLFIIGTAKEEYELNCKIMPESKDGRIIGGTDNDVFNSYFQE